VLGTTLAVRRDDLRKTQVIDRAPLPPSGPGPRAVLRVENFALTSNTITYAARAEVMSSWSFFPLDDPALGCIPAWGHATVLSSDVEGVAPGDRYFGYVPMSTHLTVQPTMVGSTSFRDGAAHRPSAIPIYNTYGRCASDPSYAPELEPARTVLRPLFMTSFVLADFLEDNRFFGAEQVVLSSASSKTAYGTAFILSQRRAVEIVALTGEKNRAFVERLGVYGRVLTYADIASMPASPTVFVDVAGDEGVRASVRSRLGENLLYHCTVGSTHWDRTGAQQEAKLEPFLAAVQLAKRRAEWGAEGFQSKLAAALRDFLDRATTGNDPWVRFVTAKGPEAVSRIYDLVVSGRAAPDDAYVLTL
jgi:hypothetical protein